MSNHTAAPDDDADAHLDDVPDGAGCTEIWERLSERRAATGRDRTERPADHS